MDPKEANRLIHNWFRTFSAAPLDLLKTVPTNPIQIDIVDGLIRRSSDFSNHIRSIKAHVQARFSAGGSVPEGVLYLVYRKTKGNIEPLYLGKAEAKGRKGNISSLFKNGGQIRFAENIGSNGHIGNLNEAWLGTGSYGHWFKTMFSTPVAVPPMLFEPVYIHMEIWDTHSISVAACLGHMSLSAEEMIRIDLLTQAGITLIFNKFGN